MISAPVTAFFSMPDTVLILVIALLLFGPKKLPSMARSIGKSMEEFRRAARDIESEIMKEPDTTPPPPPPPSTPALTEGTPESEHPYGETGEEYPGYEAELSAEAAVTAPVVVSDAPVTLPGAAAPAAAPAAAAVTPPAASSDPVAAAPLAAPAAAPSAASVATEPPAATPVNPPAEKKTDVNPAA
jgi:TatA/E family protein of Tat protein translocase